MSLGSIDYQNATFQACYGDGHAASWPASFTVHLFEGYVTDAETGLRTWSELTSDGGYAPVTVANTSANFPAPVNGEQTMTPVEMTATGAFNTTAYFAGLKDPSGVFVEYAELDEPLDVVGAGTVTIPLSFWHYNPDDEYEDE